MAWRSKEPLHNVIACAGYSVDWLIDWLVDWLIDWLIEWMIDWSINRSTDWLNDWSIDRSVGLISFSTQKCHIYDSGYTCSTRMGFNYLAPTHGGDMTGNTNTIYAFSLQWRHNVHDGVSNHWRLDCLLNRLRRVEQCAKFFHNARNPPIWPVSPIQNWTRVTRWTPKDPTAARITGSLFGTTLQWRHNERDGVSNHRRLDCLLNCLFRRRSKETSKLRITGLCEGNSPVTGEFPAQSASYAENASIWLRHNVKQIQHEKGIRESSRLQETHQWQSLLPHWPGNVLQRGIMHPATQHLASTEADSL